MSAKELDLLVDGERRKLKAELRDGLLVLQEGDRTFEVRASRLSANERRLVLGPRALRAYVAQDGERTFLSVAGRDIVISPVPVELGRRPEDESQAGAGELWVKAPMPGKVTKVDVAEGDTVRKNQTLVIVEAMKMENEIKASFDGVVKRVHVAVGDLVDADRTLVELERP